MKKKKDKLSAIESSIDSFSSNSNYSLLPPSDDGMMDIDNDLPPPPYSSSSSSSTATPNTSNCCSSNKAIEENKSSNTTNNINNGNNSSHGNGCCSSSKPPSLSSHSLNKAGGCCSSNTPAPSAPSLLYDSSINNNNNNASLSAVSSSPPSVSLSVLPLSNPSSSSVPSSDNRNRSDYIPSFVRNRSSVRSRLSSSISPIIGVLNHRTHIVGLPVPTFGIFLFIGLVGYFVNVDVAIIATALILVLFCASYRPDRPLVSNGGGGSRVWSGTSSSRVRTIRDLPPPPPRG